MSLELTWPYSGTTVSVAGTFNRWNPSPLRFDPSRRAFVGRVEASLGTFEYKFVVDGVWCYDVLKPTIDDHHGGRNNVIIVAPSKGGSTEKPSTTKKDTKAAEQPPKKDAKAPQPSSAAPQPKKTEKKAEAKPKTAEVIPEGEQYSPQEKRKLLESLLTQKFFYTVAYEIYGGVKGLYDYGPNGSALASNLEKFWREFFILEESMLQIQTATLTPEIVFKTSGHVDKFEDLMVNDTVTGECFRADHLLEDELEKLLAQPDVSEQDKEEMKAALARADDFSAKELGEQLRKYKVVAPETGNPISDPFPFNLMFSTSIGPTGKFKGYLRPETAQGMFVNFPRLLDFNNGRLPFAAAQIGGAFRNEISPRSGLLRVREFILAEIEHFVDPQDKSHPKFAEIASVELPLFSRSSQMNLTPVQYLPIGKAVAEGIVNNETLGYFLVRVYMFLMKIGIKKDKIRFRQHLQNEMAHYATDCWDAEIFTTYGWIECVGNADRACFDLTVHEKASGKNMAAFILYPDGIRDVQGLEIAVDKGAVGKTYRGEAKNALAYLESVKENQEVLKDLRDELKEKGEIEVKGLKLSSQYISFKEVTIRQTGRSINPSVIEPSFGLGRIIYCLLEHSFYTRPDSESRAVLRLKPIIAPYKTSLFPLVSDDKMLALIPKILQILTRYRISCKVDTTGTSIGKRYARTDEIGIPFGVTVDVRSVEEGSVTVRERDSMRQVRVGVEVLGEVLRDLIDEVVSWEEVQGKFVNVAAIDE